ncbi:MAG TPA: DUF3987 domain-containing protein, partial [Ktedonobacteraceae bacterium]|nr:DUF3987 domain-containing protein [Ktedonobacteraceae bacterium]
TAEEDITSQAITIPQDDSIVPALPEAITALLEQDGSDACPEKAVYTRFSMQVSPEGYEEFHDTCWYFTLSTIAGHRIKVDLSTPQYSQLMGLLAARSSMYKKTVTAEVSRKVLKAAGLDWLLGLTRTTPQKLLMDMSGPIPPNYAEMTPDVQELLKVRLAMAGQRGWIYNEFGKLIKAMHRSSGPMADFIEILLQMADGYDVFPVGTIVRGHEMIEKPYLPILGTLTPASIKAVASSGAEIWNDGFLARFVFSCPPPDTYLDSPFAMGEKSVPSQLATSLRNWHTRLGIPQVDIEPVLTEDERETGRYTKTWVQPLPETSYTLTPDTYQQWATYRSALKAIARSFGKEDFDASYERLPLMALRVAALVASLADIRNEHKIELPHWILGLQQAEKWRSSLHQLYAQVNANIADTAPTLEDIVASYMQSLGRATTAREMMRCGPVPVRKLKSKEVISLLDGLAKVGILEKTRREGSRAEWYIYLA